MAKERLYEVTCKPAGSRDHPGSSSTPSTVAGQRPSVIRRAVVRVTQVMAESPAEAKSIVEEQERALERAGHEKYQVGKAVAVKT